MFSHVNMSIIFIVSIDGSTHLPRIRVLTQNLPAPFANIRCIERAATFNTVLTISASSAPNENVLRYKLVSTLNEM